MDIQAIVNWMQRDAFPDGTIHKWALDQEALPEGIPFMGGFVELFPEAALPLTIDVLAAQAGYEAAVGADAANAAVKRRIAALEAEQTPRRLREALTDPAWLNDLETQITALRAQLT